MTIRKRTAPAAALPLAGLAALHGYWALGGPWPGTKDASLGETVVGPGAELPPPPAVWAVAGLLTGSATAVASAAAKRGPTRLARAMSWATGATLLARGAIGLPVSLLTARDTRYGRLDILVYSPLCLALGAAVVLVARAEAQEGTGPM